MDCLQASGVRAGAVLKAPDALADPQYQAPRDLWTTPTIPEGGEFKHPGVSFKSSGPLTSLGRRAPLYAEHSDWAIRRPAWAIHLLPQRAFTVRVSLPWSPVVRK